MIGRRHIYLILFCSLLSCNETGQDVSADQENPDRPTVQSVSVAYNEIPDLAKISSNQPGEYVRWIKSDESGLRRSKTIGQFTYELQYKPWDYVAMIALRAEGISIADVSPDIVDQYKGLHHFEMRISIEGWGKEFLKYGVSSQKEYEDGVKYYAFNMEDHIGVLVDGDTIPCTIFHFERTYDVKPYASFQIGFDASLLDPTQPFTFYYDDQKENNGYIKFHFPGDRIGGVINHMEA